MHEVDNETWSRSIVATLGLGIVGASREGRGNTPMVPPQHYLVGLRRSFASAMKQRNTPPTQSPVPVLQCAAENGEAAPECHLIAQGDREVVGRAAGPTSVRGIPRKACLVRLEI